MLLRSPCEFYIKYLIVHPDKYSNEAIGKVLDELGLDFISDAYVTSLRERHPPPNPFYPRERRHNASFRYILRHGLYEIFIPSDDMRAAVRILEMARAKEFVESMLLAHAPPAAIAAKVTKQRGVTCKAKAIELYKHYFWNIDLLDSTQFRALLNYRQETVGSEGEKASKEEKAQHRAAKKAGYMDPRKLAADLPYSPITALITQMRMGTMPNRAELAAILQQAQVVSALRAAEAAYYGSDQDSHRAANFAIVSKTMTDILERVVKPDENLNEELRKIGLRTDSRAMPTIFQLSDGKHTVDLLPAKGTDDDSTISGAGGEEDSSGIEDPDGDAGLPEGI